MTLLLGVFGLAGVLGRQKRYHVQEVVAFWVYWESDWTVSKHGVLQSPVAKINDSTLGLEVFHANENWHSASRDSVKNIHTELS